MLRTSVHVLASLVSGVSAALILASGSSYTEARFPQGNAHHFKGGHSTCHGGGDGCWTGPYQTANLNSVEDFCLWAPSEPALSVVKDVEHALVAWCLKGAHSNHLIPDGAISGARLLITPEYVQITGVGNLSRINVPLEGAASANGEHSHSLVFTTAYGQLERIYDWTSFVSQDRFCFRACRPSEAASTTCPPVHDVFGCGDDAPGSYQVGMFEDCVGDSTKAPSTLFQGVLAASSHDTAHPFPSCTIRRVVVDARVEHARRTIACTPDCAATSTPTTTNTSLSLPTSAPSSTTYTNSDTLVLSTPPVSTGYPSNDTCAHPHWRPHHHYFIPPSPLSSSSNVSLNSSGCWSATSSDLPPTSFASSPIPTPYSSSNPLSFETSPTPSVLVPTFTSTSMYDSSDPVPFATSPTFSPTFTYSSSSSYDPSSSPELSPSSSSAFTSSDSIASSTSSLASPPLILSSSTSPTLPPMPTSTSTSTSTSSPSESPSSSLVPILTSFSSDSTTSAEWSTLSTPSSSPSPSSSASSSVSTPLTRPSPTSPNSQTQLGSQCPPPSSAARSDAGQSVAPQPLFLLSLMLAVLTIISSSSVGVLVL